jgi:hypothetical protein
MNENDNGIILCGVCKNVSSTLPVIRAAFEELVKKSGVPCWAVFYENNSDDGTATELMKWASDAPGQVKVQCDQFTLEEELSRCVARTCDNQPCRMERIAFARNKLIGMLESDPTLELAKYVVMIDMDNPVPFPVDSVLRCIARDPEGFDALVCNGLNSMGHIYDTYAYRDSQFPFGPEITRDAFWSGHHQYYMQTAVHNNMMFFNRQMRENPARLPYVPILSGFNGMCIFRWDAIMGGMRPSHDPLGLDQPLKPLRYSAVPTAEMNAEYEALYSIPPFSNTIVNGASVGIYLFPHDAVNPTSKSTKIFYFHNSGYNFPVVCEHVPFFAALRARNRRRIYLCTDLVWNWI